MPLLGDAGELGKRVVELCAWREQWGPGERVCGCEGVGKMVSDQSHLDICEEISCTCGA
jgi:hypothetical protein